ncbi:MAG: glycerol-3-phosphate cytidylyltransferase [Lachnospiraceae bacterium]|nr:glycerol-3-phosphate cytidylyltransferase [Lachnospiraceae bacterium]
MYKIGVLGAGTWGMALARMLANAGNEVRVWSALEREVEEFSKTRRHPNLPKMIIPDEIIFTKNIEDVCTDVDIILCAVPSPFVRSTIASARPFIKDGQIIVDVAKGIEANTLFTMTQVIMSEINKDGSHGNVKLVALSGPTHAEEVSLDMPTTIVSACHDMNAAELVQDIFMNTCMRVYTNVDILGVELCGAMKNIIALASGISAGLGYGDNAKAALITRGMSEITRLGLKMGCMEQTFSGLAGIGDLIVTATSMHSRNNKAGYLIGSGMTPEEAKKEVGMVVEGINALPAAMRLMRHYHVEMPLTYAINAVINEGADAGETVRKLMERGKKSEIDKSVSTLDFESSLLKSKKDTGMRRVMTYGGFDLLHYGHINLLRRAKALGDYLIVGLSTDEFRAKEKGEPCFFDYQKRKELLLSTRYVDLVIPEDSWSQKIPNIKEYHIDVLVMGDHWRGKFDYLRNYGVDVIYLPRTPEVSTTMIKEEVKQGENVPD